MIILFINEIINSHEYYISNFKHYLDTKNERDLLLSICSLENNIKLWNVNNFECILNISNINNSGSLKSACFLNDNNQIYIITSNYGFCPELIKVYDLKGNKIKEIKNSNDNCFFICNYYDNKACKNYIITGNKEYVISYDYNENNIYHEYNDNDISYHKSIIIHNEGEKVKLIESSGNGNIRVWDFHSGFIMNKIGVSYDGINDICLWNNDCLFAGCGDNTIKLVSLKNNKEINNLYGHNKAVRTIKTFIHPILGECLLSQDEENIIKLWVIKS